MLLFLFVLFKLIDIFVILNVQGFSQNTKYSGGHGNFVKITKNGSGERVFMHLEK